MATGFTAGALSSDPGAGKAEGKMSTSDVSLHERS